ncbi:hypothetical protein VTO42DRAFT_3159 [Malbranchea cinnamomea]
MPAIRTSQLRKNNGENLERKERAYVAASRRADRSIEDRMQSADMAAETHRIRTNGRYTLHYNREIVEQGQDYPEVPVVDESKNERQARIDQLVKLNGILETQLIESYGGGSAEMYRMLIAECQNRQMRSIQPAAVPGQELTAPSSPHQFAPAPATTGAPAVPAIGNHWQHAGHPTQPSSLPSTQIPAELGTSLQHHQMPSAPMSVGPADWRDWMQSTQQNNSLQCRQTSELEAALQHQHMPSAQMAVNLAGGQHLMQSTQQNNSLQCSQASELEASSQYQQMLSATMPANPTDVQDLMQPTQQDNSLQCGQTSELEAALPHLQMSPAPMSANPADGQHSTQPTQQDNSLQCGRTSELEAALEYQQMLAAQVAAQAEQHSSQPGQQNGGSQFIPAPGPSAPSHHRQARAMPVNCGQHLTVPTQQNGGQQLFPTPDLTTPLSSQRNPPMPVNYGVPPLNPPVPQNGSHQFLPTPDPPTTLFERRASQMRAHHGQCPNAAMPQNHLQPSQPQNLGASLDQQPMHCPSNFVNPRDILLDASEANEIEDEGFVQPAALGVSALRQSTPAPPPSSDDSQSFAYQESSSPPLFPGIEDL